MPHLLSLADWSTEQVSQTLTLAHQLKDERRQGHFPKRLANHNIALLFEKDSTRTRCAFELAAVEEGAHATYLSGSHLGHKESVADTARVLSRWYHGIEFRGYHHATVEALASASSVPVWNGLTDRFHPTQALADAMTMQEHLGDTPSPTVVFVGDCQNNVATSLMLVCAHLGYHFKGLGPKSAWPTAETVAMVDAIPQAQPMVFSQCPDAILPGAHAIHTDVWVSMGDEAQAKARIESFRPYQVTQAFMDLAGPQACFMHCLPAIHNRDTEVGKQAYETWGLSSMEVTDEVFESPASRVFDQAENRLHTIKAVMLLTLGKI